jgi:two-component system OmpR family response regulator
MNPNEFELLLVEDDVNFGEVLKSYLEMHDFNVTLAKDGQEGLHLFHKDKYDLCILDVMMPKMDGFSLAKSIKDKDQEMPIIFLTARSFKEDVLEGFRTGADDYLTKPFNSEELLARIKAILKRSKPKNKINSEIREFQIGKYHFNFPIRILKYETNGEEMQEKLSPKEAQLLRVFCLNKNEVLSRSEALITIWGEDNYFTARSMDVFITKLRKYLRHDPNIELVNIHGNGFQLLVREDENVETNTAG